MNIENHIKDNFIDKLGETFQHSPEGIVISDMTEPDEPIIYCNDAFVNITGYSIDDVLGRNCRLLQNDDTEQTSLYLLREAISTNQSCKVILRNYRKTGELFFNRLSLFPVFNGDHEDATHYIGIQDDVTNLILTQEQLEKMSSEKQILISEVHHRVKNNLAVITSLLDLEMNRKNPFNALQKSQLRIKSMSTIHEYIYQQEGYSKIDFSNFLKNFQEHIEQYREEDQPKLHIKLRQEEVVLNVNQAIPLGIILSEIIHNIMQHAYKGQSHGDVLITLRNGTDENVELSIRDYGSGISELQRLKKTKTMGFTVIKTLIKQLNGSLKFLPENSDEDGFGVYITFKKQDGAGSSQSKRIKLD